MSRSMDALPGWILSIFILLAAYPWSAWLVQRTHKAPDFWLPLAVSLALGTGVLSLLMFWQMLLGFRLDLWSATLPYLALMLPGWWLWWRDGTKLPPLSLPHSWAERVALALLLLIGAGVLFNSVYWPFGREDSIGIYARFGAFMYDNRALAALPGELTIHEAYPILVPLTYSYAYLASGWPNEFLARLFPGLLSLGCLAAVFTFGKVLHSAAAGWIGALLLAITPAFTSWASSGYVDLPMAFFYTLAAIFCWQLWRSGGSIHALLAGAMMGLAAWTKNAALVGVGLMTLWLLWAMYRRRIGWQQVALALMMCAFIAATWYSRNLIEAGLIIPPTIWAEQANPSLDTLLVLITRPQTYTISGPLIVASVVAALAQLIRRRNAPKLALLLWWTLPFYGVWWLFASYDPRFILLFLPLLCVLAGVQLAKFWSAVPADWQRRLVMPLMVIATGLALGAVWNSVEYKSEILRHPFMSADERRMTAIRERQRHLYERWYGDSAANPP